ncbi:MAG: FecR family protein [Pseudobacter sp.]|uniref:FecR family protein n=1 Tax=Pseudobacter sp. TaxID=2045420 RepID=UPI003F801F66
MTKNEIIAILQKYQQGSILTADEQQKFNELVTDQELTPDALYELLLADGKVQNYDAGRWEPVLARVFNVDKAAEIPGFAESAPVVHRMPLLRKWSWAAASIILLLGVTAYFFLKPAEVSQYKGLAATDSVEIQPGKSGAILTLADGSRVSLDSIQNGVIALQGGASAKVVNGALLYEGKGQEMLYNTMSTPKGRQFQVTLPDGTDVWLNAASSIRYPTAFTGAERKVEITGEVYFEVKKNIRPFIVSADDRAEVTVLGTSFNVNSYSNEAGVKATLLEGAVQVSKGGQTVIIKPGEQADVQKNISVIKGVALEKVMAWKAGLFNFENVSLGEAMRQLERWYDIEVVYENGIPDIELDGEMSKDITLNGLMNVLKELGVRYRLEGRRLTVLR